MTNVSMSNRRVRWGILSTGKIAATFARALAGSQTGELTAVASRSRAPAERFASEHAAPRAHATYQALLDDAEVEAVYIATPHPSHAEWCIAAARAKKHVLCEKPLAMNHAQVSRVVAEARSNDVFLMEAFMYRCHPRTRTLIELLKGGVIGRVKAVHASFGIDGDFPSSSRVVNHELGGGGILDVGCYPMSMARLVAGVSNGVSFSEPLEVHALGQLGQQSGVDEYSVAICRFPGQILASLATAVQLRLDNAARIFGSEGHIYLAEPWSPWDTGAANELMIVRPGRDAETVTVAATQNAYGYEIDAVAAQLGARQAREMSWDDSLGNAFALDRWRNAIGLSYAADSQAKAE
jgi:predicted dehydrogenase